MNKYILVYTIIKTMYNNGLRELIETIIDDPDEEWDDTALHILDTIFADTNNPEELVTE